MILTAITLLFKSKATLQMENLLLRKQIEILMRRQKRPRVNIHHSWTHLGLNKDTPILQVNHPPGNGPIRSIPLVGGLHHRYERFEA